MKSRKALLPAQKQELLKILNERFGKNMNRHSGHEWTIIQQRLENNPEKLWSLNEMEKTGGEPDVAGYDNNTGEYLFFDCSAESPIGRRSICYDRQALESRREHRPASSAADMAAEMGVEILTEAQYCELQNLGEFDIKTSSWINTPSDIRNLGGALFGHRRYGKVFIFHNSAPSYYGVRGFRGVLRV